MSNNVIILKMAVHGLMQIHHHRSTEWPNGDPGSRPDGAWAITAAAPQLRRVLRVPYLSKPFVCRHKAPIDATNFTDWEGRHSHRHEFEDMEQFESNFVVPVIAGVMESDQDLVSQVRQASCF